MSEFHRGNSEQSGLNQTKILNFMWFFGFNFIAETFLKSTRVIPYFYQ